MFLLSSNHGRKNEWDVYPKRVFEIHLSVWREQLFRSLQKMSHTEILQIFEAHLLRACLEVDGAQEGRSEDEKGRVPAVLSLPFHSNLEGTSQEFFTFVYSLFQYCTLLLGGLQWLQLLWVCRHQHLPSATLLSSFLLSCLMLILLGLSDENTVSLFLSFPPSHPLLFLPSFLSVKQMECPFLLHERLLCFFSTLLIFLFMEDRIGITSPGFWFWLCLSSTRALDKSQGVIFICEIQVIYLGFFQF